MADIRSCAKLNEHPAHEWSEIIHEGKYGRPDEREYHFCDGKSREQSEEGKLVALKQVEYRNIKRLRLEFENREQVETELAFEDILPTDGVAKITVLEEDKGWACVEIRILARKPYIAREVENDGR